METNTIWALFSIDNEYNQPNNNLVCYWFSKPTQSQLEKRFSKEVSETILQFGKYHQNGGTQFRLEEVKEDTFLY